MNDFTLRRQAIRARLELIACEYRLPADEVRAARKNDEALVDFSIRHNISLDWLILGDLRGRLRMARWRLAGSRA